MIVTFITHYSANIIIALSSAILIFFSILLFLFIRYRQLSTTLAYLTRGAKALSLEDIIITHSKELLAVAQDIDDIHIDIKGVRKILQKSISRKSIVRYNPFKDLGGDQSFAIALLDGNSDGVVISSLHTREGTRVYAKPLTNGTSSYKLSTEEESAVRSAATTIKS